MFPLPRAWVTACGPKAQGTGRLQGPFCQAASAFMFPPASCFSPVALWRCIALDISTAAITSWFCYNFGCVPLLLEDACGKQPRGRIKKTLTHSRSFWRQRPRGKQPGSSAARVRAPCQFTPMVVHRAQVRPSGPQGPQGEGRRAIVSGGTRDSGAAGTCTFGTCGTTGTRACGMRACGMRACGVGAWSWGQGGRLALGQPPWQLLRARPWRHGKAEAGCACGPRGWAWECP